MYGDFTNQKIMEIKNKKQTVSSEKQSNAEEQKPKSKTTLFWEKYPNGILKIVDMRAVLR